MFTVIQNLNVRRKLVRNYPLDPVFSSILNGCFVIPAFILEQIQRFLKSKYLLLNGGLASLKQLFSLGVCGNALNTPFHKLFDVSDFKP